MWQEHKSCFVSIKTKDGELRGCIGTLSPIQEFWDREIIAMSASTRDPRSPPMERCELNNVIFSVNVLSDAEKIENITQLNPKKYGVIVSKGYRRGVVLPDLEGVDTAEQQVEIAAMKARWWKKNGSLVFSCLGKFCACSVDPVEKKPLFHWNSGSFIYSLVCTMDCPFCQNHYIAFPTRDLYDKTIETPIKELGLNSVAFTYADENIQTDINTENSADTKRAGSRRYE